MKKLCCIILWMVCCAPAFSQTFSLIADSIRKYRGVPGLVYAVFDADEVLEMGVSGVREFRTRDSIRITDRFYAGSGSTAFTAYLAAKLIDAGKLSWATPIVKALPEVNGKTMKIYHAMTIHQLLAQKAGIRPYTQPEDLKQLPAFPGSRSEQRRAFATLALKQPPLLIVDSSQPVYSLAGTVIAASMMEKITGKSWEELISTYINKPLHITARFGQPRLVDSLQPLGHLESYGSLQPSSPATTMSVIAPATDINISLKDYVVFMQDMLKALQKKRSSISQASAEHLLDPVPGNSMGWETDTWKKMRVHYFLGKSDLFSNYTTIVREKNIGIIVLCNSGTVSGKSAVLNFGRVLREYYCQ